LSLYILKRSSGETIKKLDPKYLDLSNIDYTTLKNRPFMDIETAYYDTIQLQDGFVSTELSDLKNSNGNESYYKISDKYLTEEEAYGTAATVRYSIAANGNYTGSSSYYDRYYANTAQGKATIKIKHITGKKDNKDYEYIVGYINNISKNSPAFISFPENFNGYVRDFDGLHNLSVSSGGTYVLLDSFVDNGTTYYSGIYSMSGNSGSAKKTIDEEYLDVSSDYNLLENRPFGKISLQRIIDTYYLSSANFNLDSSNYITSMYKNSKYYYVYYTGQPLTINQLYNLAGYCSKNISIVEND